MSIYSNLEKISKNQEEEKLDRITLSNGIAVYFEKGKVPDFIEIGRINMSLRPSQNKPKAPFCYSFKTFMEVGINKLPFKLWKLKDEFFSGKRTIIETRESINSDPVLKEYFNKKSLLDYIVKQERFSGKTISDIVSINNKIYNSARKMGKRNKKPEETNEIMTALLYDNILRDYFVGEKDILENTPKKYIIENLSRASKFSKNKIKNYARKLKEENIEEILNYKQENNLLTYRDLKQMEKINSKKNLIEEIKEEIYENRVSRENKHSYANIARKFGLKNGKVISKFFGNRYISMYQYEEKDSMEKLEYRLKVA